MNDLINEVEKGLKFKYRFSQNFNDFSSSFDWFTSFIFCIIPEIENAKEFIQKLSDTEFSIFMWSFSHNLTLNEQDISYPIIYYTLFSYVELILDKELPSLSSLFKINEINLTNVTKTTILYYIFLFYINI